MTAAASLSPAISPAISPARSTPPQFVDRWLGAPYLDNGRSPAGVDCYGLVVAWYAEVEGVALPDWYRADLGRKWFVETMSREVAQRIRWMDRPCDGAIAIGRRGRLCHHMGIFYAGRIIQTTRDMPVNVLSIPRATVIFGGQIDFGIPA